MSNIQSNGIKSSAHEIIDTLPDSATWDDVMHRIYVRQCIDAGIEDSEANRVVDVEDVRKKFGLMP